MEIKKNKQKIRRVKRDKKNLHKGVDTLSFCGVLKIKEDALAIQKKLRNEWQ